MSADTRPISPSRFAAALKDLSMGMLHLKVVEIRNSIAHLQYSNDQLRPFADGSATALDRPDTSPNGPPGAPAAPDQDCVDAMRENEAVIGRMVERIALIRAEVEDRGASWTEVQTADELALGDEAAEINGEQHDDDDEAEQHAAWSDGTFQTGTMRHGRVQQMDSRPGGPGTSPGTSTGGGNVSDEQLRRAVEEQLRNLGSDDDGDGGMHL